MIKIGKIGRIDSGQYAGYEIKIVNDRKNTGGFLILVSRSFEFSTNEGFDDWVEDEEGLSSYFRENALEISWMD
jgi:hypothetical protein